MKKKIAPTAEGVSAAVAEIESELKTKKVESKTLYKAVLSCEEILSGLAELSEGEPPAYEIVDTPWKKQIVLTSKGPCYENSVKDSDLNLNLDDVGDEIGNHIRQIVLNSLSDSIRYSYRKGTNRITVEFRQRKAGNPVILAVLAAVVFGFLCRVLLPGNLSAALCNYILTPVTDIMLSLLQMIVGPMVFFSITTSLSQYSDLSELGRVGGRVMLTYLATSIIAVLLGFAMFGVFSPGIAGSFSASGVAAEAASPSLLSSLTGMFPSNAVKSFYENDMLQIIVLAILTGLALNRLQTYREPVMNVFNGINELICEMMAIISRGVPLLAFASLCGVIISTGGSSLVSVVQITVTSYGGYAVMICIYLLLLRLFARVNPFRFFRKHFPYLLNSAAIMSSNASIPKTMEDCENLGVPKKIYSFSIPLGATVNMDGMSITSTIMALACAKMCGAPITEPAVMVNLAFTVLMLSMATPGVPGVACSSEVVLLSVLGLPLELAPLMITVSSLCDMGDTANNVTGDVVATFMVSAREKSLDMEKFLS